MKHENQCTSNEKSEKLQAEPVGIQCSIMEGVHAGAELAS